jgi:hypothetical protein
MPKRFSSLRRALRVASAALVVPAIWLGCSSKEQTQIVAGVLTQVQVPKELRTIRIDVQPTGGQSICFIYDVDPATSTTKLPSTLGLVPGSDPKLPVTITVTGFREREGEIPATTDCLVSPLVGGDTGGRGGARILRRARQPYSPDRVLYLPLALRNACVGVQCPENQTCKAGACESIETDVTKLVEYDPSLVFGTTSRCFATATCMQGEGPARLLDANDCTYAVPVPEEFPVSLDALAVNVRVVFDTLATEILDGDDAIEGYTLPDGAREAFASPVDIVTDPTISPPGTVRAKGQIKFRLAPNLCRLVKESVAGAPRIVGVAAALSATCSTKSQYQPLCDEDLRKALAGPESAAGLCITNNELRPTRSALYVLMDRSAAMEPFFGDAGLREVLSLSLQDPVFATTLVGLRFAPGSVGDCSAATNPFANTTGPLAVDFRPAPEARTDIAAAIGDRSKLLPDNPPVFWDAALRGNGVYQKLVSLRSDGGGPFNKQAVLVLGNRDFVSTCAPSVGRLPDLAGTARTSEGIRTYVVLLGRRVIDGEPEPADPTIDAEDLATAGGTTLFNASRDPAVGALALNTVIADLGSCLYEDPGVSLAQGLTETKISYFDAVKLSRVDVPYNASCNEANAASADGWNLDGPRVRVCGAACTSLRDTLKVSALLAAQSRQAPPPVPIRIARPCAP